MPVTFAEAYLLRKAQEISIDKRRNHKEEISQVSSLEDLHNILQKVKRCIEESKHPKAIKAIIKSIPHTFTRHVTDWKDDDMLDLLHLTIIYNMPELVIFLLTETDYFPRRYHPTYNPYCHLAAVVGHVDCLKAILQHRPSAYFACSKPIHAIKLSPRVLKNIKLSEKPPAMKYKMVDKIRISTKAAERMLRTGESDTSDVSKELDKDLKKIDLSFQRHKKQKHLAAPKQEHRRSSIEGGRRDLIASIGKHRASISTAQTHTLFQQDPKSKDVAPFSHLLPRERLRRGQHRITVYWDQLDHFEQGVVKGAGRPVPINYRADTTRSDTKIVALKNVSSWPSLNQKRVDRALLTKKTSSMNRVGQTIKPSAEAAYQFSIPKQQVHFIEMGVRGKKKYKDFHLKLPTHEKDEKDDSDSYMNKTPLTFAAERLHDDCVQLILDTIVLKRHPTISKSEPLTLATKAGSPETILLLMNKSFSRDDFQSAVLLSIREMYPVCLTALLSKDRSRHLMFEGKNLFHMLYTQCVMVTHRYELLPEMTRVLIACKEDVNAHNVARTFPMYTLINCAFNITIGKQIFFFIECLTILLEHKANPHFDETNHYKGIGKNQLAFARKEFSSAINCIFGSAKNSVKFFEKPYWSKLFMKKFIMTLETYDRTQRRELRTVLFEYMDAVCELGFDRSIVRCLLRYGANPDYIQQEDRFDRPKYAVNTYFDTVLPYLTRFEVINSYDRYRNELDILMIICRSMSQYHLSEALQIFLQDHLLSAPVQALPITRQFAAMIDHLMRTPRPLAELAAKAVWLNCKRNRKKLKQLTAAADYIDQILP